ncbi:hypothetical protein BD410DRAFT_824903 [Rickenella mellea]|uniref:P-loop containing nucleoside triphosphate hydrolase protein n=1 Tax=Rickenella mellea TaxID=50990 RepID=A0A4Y7QLT2_9AGAM|nr:hypothetical protein BD410DRAFT_824903 [Rickenella mellea]
MTTHSPHSSAHPPGAFCMQEPSPFSRPPRIDLTADDEEINDARRVKRLRAEHYNLSASDRSRSPSSVGSVETPSPAISSAQISPKGDQLQLPPLVNRTLSGLPQHTSYRPHFAGPSNSSAFFPSRTQSIARSPSVSSIPAVDPQPQKRQIIDLTSSPSPPPPSIVQQLPPPRPPLPSIPVVNGLSPEIPPKTPVCIGQLTVTALVLYPIAYLQTQPPQPGVNPVSTEWALVRLQYDATSKARNPSAEETIQIKTPQVKTLTGEVQGGESFGVVEQKVATVLGPMLAKGLIRLDAKVRRGVPNLPILPLQMLVHTPKGNVPIVSGYLQQSGLLLDHPSPCFDLSRLPHLLYFNPHNPPPGGHARNLLGQNRFGYSGAGGNRWSTPAVAGKSVEVQRSQVDEMFKSLKSGDDLEETEPTADVATKLYPHQKKALTFLLEREGELTRPGVSSSLWQKRINPHSRVTSWVNLVSQREVFQEPKECKGSLLADDMGLGKTITCVSLIAATLESAQAFASLPLPPPPRPPLEHSNSAPSLSASHFAGSVWGMPDTITPSHASTSTKGKASAAKAQEKAEAEYIRARRIKCRSRATLIICPLSTVMNWEEQFREHWAGEVQVMGGGGGNPCAPQSQQQQQPPFAQFSFDSQGSSDVQMTGSTGVSEVVECKLPSTSTINAVPARVRKGNTVRVYVYHGNARRPDPAFLADFDAVITTYATLASEFSKQSKSLAACDGCADDDDDDDDGEGGSDSGGAVECDEHGNQVLKLPKAKDKKSLKRKKTAMMLNGAPEQSSPLQSIHWFRVVLDEAHSIKETSTVGSRASCDLAADRRLCLTGTPVQNKLDDVFALIKFLRLEPFDEKSVWQEFIGVPVKFGQPLGVARLQTIMKCITLRRTKESKAQNGETILSLPPRRDELRYLKFDEQEQSIYNEFFKESKAEFNELSDKNEVMKNYVGILQKILRLRQICDHFELVEGKGPQGSVTNYEDIVADIAKDGINVSRAYAIFCLLRESGTAQCVECGCELGASEAGQSESGGLDSETSAPTKRGRKGKGKDNASSRGPTRPGSPALPRPILSRCQHLFCLECFRQCIFPGWPNVAPEVGRSCSACQTGLTVVDAVEVSGDPAADGASANGKKRAVKKEKRVKGTGMLDKFHPSTKVKALLGDLVVFSRANQFSANYDPSTIEVQMVDEHGNNVDDGPIKTVVFSQWTSMLDKVEDALEAAGIRYDRLDGTMKRDERTRAMDNLKHDPGCEVLLVSLKAGGVGLNLTAAQRVYLMDPYWNPAVENQAVDRIHRLGQTRPVTTVKLIIENTIEARLLEVQKKKTELANMTLGQHLSKAEMLQRRMEELNQLFGG